jgi:CTP synthase (UTP-ammonia lyase)
MQIAVIEFARNVCHIPGAGSVELDDRCPDSVAILMPEIDKVNLGGDDALWYSPYRLPTQYNMIEAEVTVWGFSAIRRRTSSPPL